MDGKNQTGAGNVISLIAVSVGLTPNIGHSNGSPRGMMEFRYRPNGLAVGLSMRVSNPFATILIGVAISFWSIIMSNKRSAPDGLKFATYLWRTDRDAEYARSVLNDLLVSYPNSDEAAAASDLLEEINSGAHSISGISISGSSEDKEARRLLTTVVLVASGIGLIFFGRSVMYSGPSGDGGIYGLFGVLIIAAGGLLAIVTTITWVIGMLARLFGGKRFVLWMCILLAAAVIVSVVAPVIGIS